MAQTPRFVPPPALRARLLAMYREPHRHYHTLAHIAALRRRLTQWRALALDVRVIDAAIWFHDAVYDTRRGDNEARSAQLARHELGALAWPAADVDRVAGMVLATQHHDSAEANASDADTLLFLDLDLSVLADRADRYDAYCAAVRAEYAWVDAARWRAGRAKVLHGFAQRSAIYRTPMLHSAWEARARRNLARESKALESSVR